MVMVHHIDYTMTPEEHSKSFYSLDEFSLEVEAIQTLLLSKGVLRPSLFYGATKSKRHLSIVALEVDPALRGLELYL